ncbi:MAG: hypothetical protein K6F58_06110 [Bacteroidales bacterium]|nr:hypothetical protein [Bacteroidales bacterium]
MTVEGYPNGFPQEYEKYDENGISRDFSLDRVITYDLYTKTIKTVDIKWDSVDCGKPVSGYCHYSGGDYFTINGMTRNATNVVFLVEIETGNVSLTELTEYSGSVVTSYYRLN